MSELGRETNELLERGRDGESLQAGDKARVRRALLAQVAGISVVATSSTAGAWTTLTATKVVCALVVAAGVSGGAAMLVSRRPTTSTARPQEHAAVATASNVRSTPSTPIGLAADTAAAQPAIATVPPRETTPVHVENVHVENAHASVGAPPAATPTAEASGAFTSSLEAEAELLGQADDALKVGSPERALRILDDLAARFPASALAPERAAQRVFALCMAGRTDEARRAAGEFEKLEQTGPLAARVHASCAGRAQ